MCKVLSAKVMALTSIHLQPNLIWAVDQGMDSTKQKGWENRLSVVAAIARGENLPACTEKGLWATTE
jgi:hypothetical protein